MNTIIIKCPNCADDVVLNFDESNQTSTICENCESPMGVKKNDNGELEIMIAF